MATRGVAPGTPKAPGSGRRKGTRNKAAISKEEIVECFHKLGGMRWFVSWARDNPSDFVGKVLCRVLPPVPREPEEPAGQPPTINVNMLSDFEIARRIAFALAKGVHDLEEQQTDIVEAVPPDPAPPQPDHQETTLANYEGGESERAARRRKLL